MLNVDLGYLTFKMAFGNFELWQMKYGKDVAIAAIDNKPKRKEVYPNYKLNRNVGKEEIVQTVWQLRKQVEKEQTLPLCSIEGLEADDIVACWQLFNPDHKIVGVDKDFFQLPNVENLYYHDLKPYNFLDTLGKLPQYVQPLAAKNFALYQMLLGDVADNIPRLLSKGKDGKIQLEYIADSYYQKRLKDCLLDLFGDAIVTNAKLVLCPYYEWYSNGVEDWFAAWCSGHYYDRICWIELYNEIQKCKLPNRCSEQLERLELFGLI